MTHNTTPALSGEELDQAGADIVLATWPHRIWLQGGDVDERESFQAASRGEITWCQDSIDKCDVEYVRADLAQARAARQAQPVDAALLDALRLIAAQAAEGAGSRGPAGWMGAIARAALAQAAPADLTDDLDDDEVAIPADLTEVEYWRRRASAARALARSFRARAAVVAIPAPAERECQYPHETAKCLGCGWTKAQAQSAGAGAPSIDTPEFRGLLHDVQALFIGDASEAKAKLIAHIDAQLARQGAAPAQAEPVAWGCKLNLAFEPMETPDLAWGIANPWNSDYEPFPLYATAPAHAGVAQAGVEHDHSEGGHHD